MKNFALWSLVTLIIVAGIFAVISNSRDRQRMPMARPAQAEVPFEGALSIISLDDFRVSGRRILLCGVQNARPAAMRPLLLEAAKSELNNQEVSCVPVGLGTVCDGRAAASFGRASVVQCRTRNGNDIAAILTQKGILCDLPAQSGGAYASCVGLEPG
jgi:hypothetical protein